MRTIDWSDTSKIVSLFTREKGRVDVIAKGARRKNNPYQGVIETLNEIDTVIYLSEKRDLQTLGAVSLENSWREIRTDLKKTSVAMAMLEIMQHFFHEGQGDQIFYDFLLTMLEQLAEINCEHIILWYFMLKTASRLGFKPEMDKCNGCGKTTLSGSIEFDLTSGVMYESGCSPGIISSERLTPEQLEFLSRLQKVPHRKLNLLSNISIPEYPYTKLLQNYLNYHTDSTLELKSLRFLAG